MKYYPVASCFDCKKYDPGFNKGHCGLSNRDMTFDEAKTIPDWCDLPDIDDNIEW